MKVCVIEFPAESELQAMHLEQFLLILASTTAEVSVITGNFRVPPDIDVHPYLIADSSLGRSSFLRRLTRFVILQMRLLVSLIRNSKEIELVISFHDYISNLLPVIFAKVLGKRIGIYVGGSPRHNILSCYPGKTGVLLYFAFTALENLVLRLSDMIIPLSRGMISFQGLDLLGNKISPVDGARFIDDKLFMLGDTPNSRQNIISFVGRLSGEKGILNFLSAIPLVENRIDAIFWILGDGDLAATVASRVSRDDLQKSTVLLGFIKHEQLPAYLRQTKLVVLPSYSEGLPTIALEAMACGAILVASNVGGVSDIVSDGKTGFLLDSNSPKIIAETIEKALSNPSLSKIQRNGRALIESKYTFECAVLRWESILKSLQCGVLPDES